MQSKIYAGARGSVHYWVKGDHGPWVVFTHGASMDHGMFQFQVEYFAQDYRVLTWDIPLHGRSRPYAGFTLQNAAQDLAAILEVESAANAHLVGQSMGGYVVQYLARDCPERALSLTAIGSSPIQPSYYSALDRWLLSITPALLMLYPYNYLIRTISNQVALHEPARTYALEVLQGLTKAEIAHIMGITYLVVKEDEPVTPLPLPVLIVYGDSDRTGKVRSYCQRWAEREKRPLKTIPNAAHNANMDNPQAFNQVLAEFLKSVDRV